MLYWHGATTGNSHRASDRTCTKVVHGNWTGQLHAHDDDAPFDVDGVPYCGRCHHFIDANGWCSPRRAYASQETWDEETARLVIAKLTAEIELLHARPQSGLCERHHADPVWDECPCCKVEILDEIIEMKARGSNQLMHALRDTPYCKDEPTSDEAMHVAAANGLYYAAAERDRLKSALARSCISCGYNPKVLRATTKSDAWRHAHHGSCFEGCDKLLPEGAPRSSFDARKWAQAFNLTAKTLGYQEMDEDWLVTWFANAIMRGYDERDLRVSDTPSMEGVAPGHVWEHMTGRGWTLRKIDS